MALVNLSWDHVNITLDAHPLKNSVFHCISHLNKWPSFSSFFQNYSSLEMYFKIHINILKIHQSNVFHIVMTSCTANMFYLLCIFDVKLWIQTINLFAVNTEK